jgi:hypothetical protein
MAVRLLSLNQIEHRSHAPPNNSAVGLLDAVISIDELTGGKMLSWLSLPLLMVGQIIAAYIAGLSLDSFGLIIQFFLVVCCVELIIVMVFRSRIERFVTARR